MTQEQTSFMPTILKAYETLGYKPRNDQELIVDSILNAFINENKRNVILSADTGIGKSIIGGVVSECIKQIEHTDRTSFILMHQNSLADQYAASYEHLSDLDYFQIKGATNYPCQFLQKVHGKSDATGEDCTYNDMTETEQAMCCYTCPYKESRKLMNATSSLISNYSFFFVAAFGPKFLRDRPLHVFDEAHVINDIFCDHVSLKYNSDSLQRQVTELTKHSKGKCDDSIETLKNIESLIINKNVTDLNYIDILTELRDTYVSIALSLKPLIAGIPDLQDKTRMRKLHKKYDSHAAKITLFLEEEYEHVFDDTVEKEFSIRAIFVKDMIEPILGKYNLFMSATISEMFAEQTYGLNPNETAYIEAKQVFPSKNRPLLFLGQQNLNYERMKDPNTIDVLKSHIDLITQNHSTEKGLILVPSFALSRKLCESINRDRIKVFEHRSGVYLPDLISEFKAYTGPGVLISPSIFEGLDFKGDDSRYQIIVKTPFASLGDRRIHYISLKYPSIYREMALLKIIQGIGRSIRSVEDHATTYFLDGSSKTLYNSPINIWKARFKVIA